MLLSPGYLLFLKPFAMNKRDPLLQSVDVTFLDSLSSRPSVGGLLSTWPSHHSAWADRIFLKSSKTGVCTLQGLHMGACKLNFVLALFCAYFCTIEAELNS